MTMPKKNRRAITVNDTLYHYSVSAYSITIHNIVTGEIITESKDHKDTVFPSDIKYLINRKGM